MKRNAISGIVMRRGRSGFSASACSTLSLRFSGTKYVFLQSPAGHCVSRVNVPVKDPSSNAGRAAEFARYPPGHAEGYGDAFRVVLRDAYLAMAGEPHGSYPTFADGHRGMQVLEATLHSARDGGWASVET